MSRLGHTEFDIGEFARFPDSTEEAYTYVRSSNQFPSIFNDVIGPVMIGHSSSHTAASVRIGNVIRCIAGDERIKSIRFSFDTQSSLAETYSSQGSDIGLLSGILGFQTFDGRIPNALALADKEGIEYSFEVKDIGPGHPNAYYIEFVTTEGTQRRLTAVSTGGGMIEITKYMGFETSIDCGFFETLIICGDSRYEEIVQILSGLDPGSIKIAVSKNDGKALINVKSIEELDLCKIGISKDKITPPAHVSYSSCGFSNMSDRACGLFFADIRQIRPVLPVMSQLIPSVPFITAEGILEYAERSGLPLWELAVLYESERGGFSPGEVMDRMMGIIHTLRSSLATEDNDEIDDRILPNQSKLMDVSPNIIGGRFNKNVIKYVTRFMDIKASMGIFVAAPTAGSCGCVIGTVFALGEELQLSGIDIARACLSAGIIGVLIAHHSTFAAEVAGCQAECGSGSGMCAAACAGVMGGSVKTCISAASMALQNIFGMVCDPVGNKVEVPCLGKNIMSAFNAIACANMAMAGYDEVIPLDETIAAMDSVGRSIPRELRCTGLGGLSQTKTGRKTAKG